MIPETKRNDTEVWVLWKVTGPHSRKLLQAHHEAFPGSRVEYVTTQSYERLTAEVHEYITAELYVVRIPPGGAVEGAA